MGATRRQRHGEAHVWGEATPSLRTADAALVNGTASHAFELDDYHNAKLHPGAVVMPAAIAVAEKLDASGADLVTAIAAGYEVMIRSSLALNPSAARLRGWHLTGVCGPFGAAAACASLLKLNTEQTAWALGLAGTQGAGLWAFNADGTMSKRLHAGKAAHSGVLAAELAQLGFTGPTQIYEFEDGGVLKAFSDASDPAPLTQDLGAVYHLDKTSIKPYSCCGSTHSYIDAALALRKKLGTPWDAEAARARRHVQSGRRAMRLRLRAEQCAQRANEFALHGRGGAAGRPGAAGAVHRRQARRSRDHGARGQASSWFPIPSSTSCIRRISPAGSPPSTTATGNASTS